MQQRRFTVWGVILTLWVLCIIASAVLTIVLRSSEFNGGLLHTLISSMEALFPLLFAVPAALIISRQPRNVIGWLLLAPTFVFVAATWINNYLVSFQSAPTPTLPIMLMMLFSGAAWLALIFPLLLIPVLFPTGRPPSPRWNWVVYLAAGMCVFFLFWVGFAQTYQLESVSWKLTNPLGFLSDEVVDIILPVWSLLLAVLAVTSLLSIVVRYRRAAPVERQQMKWLLFACALFVLVYAPSVMMQGADNFANETLGDLFDLLFFLSIAAIPASIAIAILRYHLYDIDVIIRLTLVYTVVTATLAMVYLGGIVMLQAAFRTLTGQTQDIAVVITTLIMAALFNPLRQRIQAIIDRRFFRQKYNAEQALSEFAVAARSVSDLDVLTGMLVEITQKTLQPTQVGIYLKPGNEQAKTQGPDLPLHHP